MYSVGVMNKDFIGDPLNPGVQGPCRGVKWLGWHEWHEWLEWLKWLERLEWLEQ
jgi:hypothetical protein